MHIENAELRESSKTPQNKKVDKITGEKKYIHDMLIYLSCTKLYWKQ